MKTVQINNGLTVSVSSVTQEIDAQEVPAYCVAWQPPAYGRLSPESIVKVNQIVGAGESLFIDKNAPLIRHVAPASGQVTEIIRDSKHQITHILIALGNTPPVRFAIDKSPYTYAKIRKLLMASGLWTQIRQRPFDTVPSIDSQPDTILVSAIDSSPSAPDPQVIIQHLQSEFDTGLEALLTQTSGTLWVCQSSSTEVTSTGFDRTKMVRFDGGYSASTPSLHIQELCGSPTTQSVWHIDYQDVIAIGYLLLNGIINSKKIVSLCGNQICNPRLVTTNAGANISDLLENESVATNGSCQPIVGNYLSMRTKQWLGKFDQQVSLMHNTRPRPSVPVDVKPSIRGFVPDPVFDRVNTLDILPIPLLRALVSGDIELAKSLGCLEISPEDLDIFSYVCPEGNNYSDFLRHCHRQLLERNVNGTETSQNAV